MKTQNIFKKYLTIYKFHSAYGTSEGIKRVWSIFKELDLFDFTRGLNTRTIKVQSLEKISYMPYWPAFTSVVLEMIKFSHNYYISAIRYSDLQRKTVFVDFGSGLAKVPIIAGETKKFDACGGIEIDPELSVVAAKNLKIIEKRLGKVKLFSLIGNVESPNDIANLIDIIEANGISAKKSTIFIFNKNSYGPDTLKNSLMLIEKYFSSVVYLYQNPIHGYILEEQNYIQFGADSKVSTINKNYKYKLYFKHKY